MRERARAAGVPHRAKAVAVHGQLRPVKEVEEDVRCGDAVGRGDVDRRRRRRHLAGRGADIVELVRLHHALVAVGPHLDWRVAERQSAGQGDGNLRGRIDHQRVTGLSFAEQQVYARIVDAVLVSVVERACLEACGRGSGALIGDGRLKRAAQGERTRIAHDLLRIDRAHDQIGKQRVHAGLAQAHRADVDVGQRRQLEREILGQVACQRETDLRLPCRQSVEFETPVRSGRHRARSVAYDRPDRHAGEGLVVARVERHAPRARDARQKLEITEGDRRGERAVRDGVERCIEEPTGDDRCALTCDEQLAPGTEIQASRGVDPVAGDLAVGVRIARRVEGEARNAVAVGIGDEQLTARAERHVVRIVQTSPGDDAVRNGVPEGVEDIPLDFVDPAAFGDEQLPGSRVHDNATGGGIAKTRRDGAVRHREAGAVEFKSQHVVAESLRDEQLAGLERRKMGNAETARSHSRVVRGQPARVGKAGDRSEIAGRRSSPVHDEHLARLAECEAARPVEARMGQREGEYGCAARPCELVPEHLIGGLLALDRHNEKLGRSSARRLQAGRVLEGGVCLHRRGRRGAAVPGAHDTHGDHARSERCDAALDVGRGTRLRGSGDRDRRARKWRVRGAVRDRALDRRGCALRHREQARGEDQRAADGQVATPGSARVAALVGDGNQVARRDAGDLVAAGGVCRGRLPTGQADRRAGERQTRRGVAHRATHHAGRRLPVLGQRDCAEIDRLPGTQHRGERDHAVLTERQL